MRPADRVTSTLEGPGGLLEFITTGSGSPATVFAHGVDGTIETTRPFGSGVKGSRTFLHFRGYGASADPGTPWTYPELADELRTVADHVRATQALGVSMGAGALCALLAQTPRRFERLVFVLPAVLDRPRTDLTLDHLAPTPLAPNHLATNPLARDRVAPSRVAPSRVAPSRLALATTAPLMDRAVLAAVTAPALVIAQEDDPSHPVWVAEQLAASLPGAHLEVLPPGGILVRHRAAMRDMVGRFLSGDSDGTDR